MIDLLKNLIEDYLNSLPEPEEMDKIEKVSALRHNISNITEIELDEHLIKFIYEKDDVTAVLRNLLFIQKIMYAEKKGIHFDLEAEQKRFLSDFVELADIKKQKETDRIKKYKNPYSKILTKIDNEELITEIDLITKILSDKDVPYETRNEIIMSLLKYNDKNKETPKIEIKKEVKLSEEELSQLLSKYSYDINQIKENNIKVILNEGNYDNIKQTLEKLRSRSFNFVREQSDLFTIILVYSNADVLTNIEKIAMEEGFPIRLLETLKNVFVPKRTSRVISTDYKKLIVASGYENFLEIVDILKRKKVDVKEALKNAQTLFRMSPTRIKDNIKAFELYGLRKKDDIGLSTHSWMTAPDLMGVCDKFIELGMYEYIERYHSKLTLSPDNLCFYRIYYCQTNHIPYYHHTENSSFLRKDVYGVGSDFINIHNLKEAKNVCKTFDISKRPYIDSILTESKNNTLSEIVFQNKVLAQLEKYKKNNYVYDFDGRLISRLKVLRLAETILKNGINIDQDILLYIMTYDSIITEEEINKIRQIIDTFNYGKELK